MAANYTALKTEISAWLARSDLTSYVDTFIDFAEARINRNLRLRAMQTAEDLTVSAQSVALPTGYKEARRIYLDVDPKQSLKYVTPEQLYTTYAGSMTGKPRVFTIEGSNIIFGPSPDTTYTGKILFYKSFESLSDSNTTNWLLTNAPDLYCFTSLLMAEPFIMNDKRIPVWTNFVSTAIEELNNEDWNGEHSGSALQMRTDIGNP